LWEELRLDGLLSLFAAEWSVTVISSSIEASRDMLAAGTGCALFLAHTQTHSGA
jgi:hypothetical protein